MAPKSLALGFFSAIVWKIETMLNLRKTLSFTCPSDVLHWTGRATERSWWARHPEQRSTTWEGIKAPTGPRRGHCWASPLLLRDGDTCSSAASSAGIWQLTAESLPWGSPLLEEIWFPKDMPLPQEARGSASIQWLWEKGTEMWHASLHFRYFWRAIAGSELSLRHTEAPSGCFRVQPCPLLDLTSLTPGLVPKATPQSISRMEISATESVSWGAQSVMVPMSERTVSRALQNYRTFCSNGICQSCAVQRGSYELYVSIEHLKDA